MEDNNNIKMEQPTSTDENQPKKEKKRLPKKQRIAIGIIMILIACATLILGIMIQVKGFDIFSNKASVGGDNIAYASSNDGAQVASAPNLPQGKNLFDIEYIKSINSNRNVSFNSFDFSFTYFTGEPNNNSIIIKPKNILPNTAYTFTAVCKSFSSPNEFNFSIVYTDGSVVHGSYISSTSTDLYTYYISSLPDKTLLYFRSCWTYSLKSSLLVKGTQLEVGSVATAYEPNYNNLIKYGAQNNSYNPLKKGDVIQDLYFNFDKPIFDVKKVFPNYSNINTAPFDDFKYFMAGSFHTVHTRGFKLKLFNNVNNDIILNYWLNTDFSSTPDCFTIDIIIGGKQYISYFGSSGSTSLNASTIVFIPYDTYGTIPPELPIYQADNIHFSEPLTLQADFPLSQQMCQGGLGVWLSANRHFYFDKNTILNEGFNNGYGSGYTDGKKDGILEADSNNQNFGSLLLGIMDAPFKVFRDAFNFEIFGINVSALILFFITILCVSLVIKKLI